jgi:hypothetical protein
MTDPEKLRALIAEMRRANECINAAVTATDYQVACVALALIARQFLRDSEALSTLLAEAERPHAARPTIVPRQDGGEQWEWHQDGFDVEIEFKDGRIVGAFTEEAERPTPPVEDAVTRAKLENCQHERLNDHGDACLDCRAIYMDGKWQ